MFLTQSDVKEVGQVRDNHIFIFLITWVAYFKIGAENSSKPGEQSSIILPKNLETGHIITARLGQSKASAVLFIPCEIRPRPKGTAEARASMCPEFLFSASGGLGGNIALKCERR